MTTLTAARDFLEATDRIYSRAEVAAIVRGLLVEADKSALPKTVNWIQDYMDDRKRRESALLNRIDCWLWALLWRNHLKEGEQVKKVLGWRTALVDSPGSRKCVTPCVWIFQ